MGDAATLQELDQRIAAIRDNIGEQLSRPPPSPAPGMRPARQNVSPNKSGCSPRSSKSGSRSQDRLGLRATTSVPDEALPGRDSVGPAGL
jgi:hypothetical protein